MALARCHPAPVRVVVSHHPALHLTRIATCAGQLLREPYGPRRGRFEDADTDETGHRAFNTDREADMRIVPIATAVGATAAALILATAPAFAETPGSAAAPGAVFAQTDDLHHNSVVAFARASSGRLARMGEVRTGGRGGVEQGVPLDSLASQDSLTYDPTHRLLLAVNAGSDTVSSFAVNGARLTLRQTVPSGGGFPVSVAARKGLAYILNAGGSGSVTGYRINKAGRLTPLPGSHRGLGLHNEATPQFITAPADIAITPDRGHVLVTTKANNTIDVFNIDRVGRLSQRIEDASAGSVPFALSFDPSRHLVVANAGGSTVSTYVIKPNGTLSTVTAGIPDGQSALCWIVAAGDTFYGANAGSSTISAFAVDAGGHAALTATSDGVVAQTGGGTGGTIDLAVTRNQSLLYAENSFAGTVEGYRIEPDHTLVLVSTATGLPKFDGHGMEGLAAI